MFVTTSSPSLPASSGNQLNTPSATPSIAQRVRSFWRDWWYDRRNDATPVTNENVLMIIADIKKGTVSVSYKGHAQRAYFDDNTLRNLVKGIRFEKSSMSFFGAVAQLILKLQNIIKFD